MLIHYFSKEIFPDIQPEHPLVQLSSCPIGSCLGEGADPPAGHNVFSGGCRKQTGFPLAFLSQV